MKVTVDSDLKLLKAYGEMEQSTWRSCRSTRQPDSTTTTPNTA